MNYKLHNEQSVIADDLLLSDDFTAQTARLTHFKINYYKFTLIRPSFIQAREILRSNIRDSLFNFVTPSQVLHSVRFYEDPIEN
jgi:hypothetical protein